MSIWDNIYKISGSDIKPIKDTNKKIRKKHKDNRINCNNTNLILSQKGLSINNYLLDDLKIKRKLINYFTIKIDTLTGYVIKVTNHLSDAKSMLITFPRFGFLEYAKIHFKNFNIINNIRPGKRPSIPFQWTGKFTNNQPLIVNHIMQKFFNTDMATAGKSGVVLNLKAGQGKTFLATGLMEKLQRKTLVICHNKTIMHQWIKVLKKAYPKNIIASFYGEQKENGDIVVGIINTLVKQNHAYFKDFGYVILDEVHEYCSKTRKKIYSLGQSTYMIGLSATPNERADGLDQATVWNCGPILNASELDGYTEDDLPFTGEVRMIKYIGSNDYTKIITNPSLDIVSFSQMVSQICSDPHRIHLIVKTIYELREKNMQILVFADRRSYLTQIREELDRFHIISDVLDDVKINSKRVVGGSSAEDVEYAELYSNVILSTYQYFGTGKINSKT